MFNTIHEVMYEVYTDNTPTGIRVGFLYDILYGEDPEKNASKELKHRFLTNMYPEVNGYKLVEIYDQEV